MKIVKKEISNKKDRKGYVQLVPQDEEDIWYLYNLIFPGDILRLRTFRKTTSKEGDYGVKKVKRRAINLTVSVLKVGFEADDKGTSLTVKTRNLYENNFVMKGQVQTVEIKLFSKLRIFKMHWDEESLRLLGEAANDAKFVDSLIVLYDDGYAGFYFVKRNFTKFHAKIANAMPKKKPGLMEVYNKKAAAFDRKVWRYLFESFNMEEIKAVVVGGPGNAKERFVSRIEDVDKYEKDLSVREQIEKHKSKFVCIATSSTFKTSINEILKDKKGVKLLEDTKAVKETQKFEEFFDILQKNPDCAVYGQREVLHAQEQNAIKTLLITDGLLRSKNFAVRKKFSQFKKEVEMKGGEIFLFSENHVSGQKLKDITGIAAILRFPIDLDVLYEEEGSEGKSLDRWGEVNEGEEDPLNKSFEAEGLSLFADEDEDEEDVSDEN